MPPELADRADFLTEPAKLTDESLLAEWETQRNGGEPWAGRSAD